MHSTLDHDIQFLSSVGPKRAELLRQELDINTIRDLINYLPFRYIDRSTFYPINQLRVTSAQVQTKGKIVRVKMEGAEQEFRLEPLNMLGNHYLKP